MAWEIYNRKIMRSIEPTVTLTTLGRVALNKGASAQLEKLAAEYVLLYWDSETNRCGIKVIGKKDQRSYRLHYGKNGNGAGFSAVTFLNHVRYDWSQTRTFPLQWQEDENMFTFAIPAEHLTGLPKGQDVPLGKIRRSDRAKENKEEPKLELVGQ
jgi:hypothetical protein